MRDVSEIIRHAIGEHFKDIQKDDAQAVDQAARGVKFELRRIENILENINETARFFGDKKIDRKTGCMKIDQIEYYDDDVWNFCFYPNAGNYMGCSICLHEDDIHLKK